MDRTIIVPYRAEEKELSHILHNAIQGLILLHPPTEDLRKCLSDEMFIKPNQQAFFHVMHYLFRLLDPQEFKKRFFWPITDKRSESNFRTCTVEYLKHINEKYQLNWTNIKSYLVVMPGGMKFITFLLDFVNFIVRELIKQKEKQLNIDANNYRSHVSETNLHKMCAKNEFLKGMASEFIDTVENLNAKYEDKSQKLMQHLENLSQESNINLDSLTGDKFLESFEVYNYQLFDRHYSDRSKKILEMDTLIGKLKETMDKFYSIETGYKYDKQRIYQQLKRIQENFLNDESAEESFGSKVTDKGIDINNLISTFNAIIETIQSELKMFNKKPCAGKFVYSRLLSLKKELQEMETQITNFKKNLHENMKKNLKTPVRANVIGPTKRNLENNFLMKLVSTPPIKFEVPEGGGKSRIALVDSKVTSTNETTFNNFLVPPRASAMRQTNRHHSLLDQTISDLNNTMSRSKIIDPMQLLRSTSKKDSSKYKASTPQSKISSLGIQWKLRENILNGDDEEASGIIAVTPKINCEQLVANKTSSQSFNKTVSSTMLNQSPFIPFSSNDRTQIATFEHKLDFSAVNISESPLNYVKKLSAVKKVQDASLNFAHLSTSPSGRLEPLVTADDGYIPKLKINDMSLIEHNESLNNSLVNSITVNYETNSNSDNVNKQRANIPDEYEQEKDALFNISDSVLKDVTL